MKLRMNNLRIALLVLAALLVQTFIGLSVVRAYTVYVAPAGCAAFPSPYAIAPMPGPQDYPLFCKQNAYPTGGATPTATPVWYTWVGGSTGWSGPGPSPAPTPAPTATPPPV